MFVTLKVPVLAGLGRFGVRRKTKHMLCNNRNCRQKEIH